MLCPEVWDFPPPKVFKTHKQNEDLDSVKKTVNMNYFYKSLIITCPDEIHTPSVIQDLVTEDTDYYKLTDCSITALVEPVFIESFVKNGQVYCLSVNRDCMTHTCAALTPTGHLILHTPDYIFQTLGFEGIKRPNNFYEICIDLNSIKNYEKVKSGLKKLELFDFYIIWEPTNENVCPSTIAKYFNEEDITVSIHSLTTKNVSPSVNDIPVLEDVDAEEMVEWIGLLAHEADLTPTETYISSYVQPESENALKSSRISLLIVKGFMTPSLINGLCSKLSEYVTCREMSHHWVTLSVQSNENSLWQWNRSSPRMFQAHNSSTNIFFKQNGNLVHTIGELKYT